MTRKEWCGRVIYLDVLEKEKLYLLFAYPKNVQEDLPLSNVSCSGAWVRP